MSMKFKVIMEYAIQQPEDPDTDASESAKYIWQPKRKN